MMTSAQYFDENGVLISEVIDNGDGTGTVTFFNADGTVLSTETLTDLVLHNLPLDPVGALATLLVVEGVTDLTSAADVVRLPEQALIDEAVAWSLG
jgi:hypothetical protein